MDVKEAITIRRAYRSLEQVDIDDRTIEELAQAARLAPSCFNNQPWRFIFVRTRDGLDAMKGVMGQGNEWTFNASMIVAVFANKASDCVIKDREYYLFDTGMATAFLMLRATELGLVAHPIAGYDPAKVRKALGIPDTMQVITLVIVGKKMDKTAPGLSQKQMEVEKERPQRKPLDAFMFHERYAGDGK